MNTNGTLYIVATPIGNLDDLSPRALQILRSVNLIAAEDTQHIRRLLDHFGIHTATISLHEHNEQQRIEYLIKHLKQKQSIALISDAGTPLISDPGYRLVYAVRNLGIKIIPIPGPCALIAALSASGLPSDRFVFEGFLPAKSAARQKRLQELCYEMRTLIFYEAPHRILELIEDMIAIFGIERQTVIARELSKTFETIQNGNLVELKNWLITDVNQQKGEFVVLVHGNEKNESTKTHALHILDILLTELPISQAIKLAAKITGEKKNWLYETALQRKKL